MSVPGEILYYSWEISMHQLELIGMVMRHVLVPMGLELRTRIALSSLTLQDVMDLGWLLHGFRAHRLIAGLGIPMLVVWQRRLTMDSLMVAGGWSILNCRVDRSAQFLNTDTGLL